MRELAEKLRQLVHQAEPALRSIAEESAREPLKSGGWSRKQALGHLIDSASNNHQRWVRAALEGALEWPNYDQNGCVRIEAFQAAEWGMLINLWSSLNWLLAHILANLPPDKGAIPCRVGDNPTIPLEELAHAYIDHLVHHLEQLGALKSP